MKRVHPTTGDVFVYNVGTRAYGTFVMSLVIAIVTFGAVVQGRHRANVADAVGAVVDLGLLAGIVRWQKIGITVGRESVRVRFFFYSRTVARRDVVTAAWHKVPRAPMSQMMIELTDGRLLKCPITAKGRTFGSFLREQTTSLRVRSGSIEGVTTTSPWRLGNYMGRRASGAALADLLFELDHHPGRE